VDLQGGDKTRRCLKEALLFQTDLHESWGGQIVAVLRNKVFLQVRFVRNKTRWRGEWYTAII